MLDLFDVPAQRCRVEHTLSWILIAVGEVLEYRVQSILKSHVQEAIGLVQHNGLN